MQKITNFLFSVTPLVALTACGLAPAAPTATPTKTPTTKNIYVPGFTATNTPLPLVLGKFDAWTEGVEAHIDM